MLALTERGLQALQATSVLDADAVANLLHQLSPRQRRAAVTGLRHLARAALELTRKP